MVNLRKIVEEYEILFLVDRSYSMDTADVPVSGGFLGFGGKKMSRWEAVGHEIAAFVKEVEKIDSDGLDLVFFGGTVDTFSNQNSGSIMQLFSKLQTNGGTPLDRGLNRAFGVLESSPKAKKFIFCYTDGAPNDRQAVRNTIIAQANSQKTDDEMTILFVQVGNDQTASQFLAELDDDLVGAKYDIVDAKTADEARNFKTVADLIAHAIND